MADIDMIPRSYREAVRVERALRWCGIGLLALLVGGVATGALLRWRVRATEPVLAQMRAATAQASTDAARVAALQLEVAHLTQGVAALEALRAAGTVDRVTGALDHALTGRVWLSGIRYARSEQVLPPNVPAQPDDFAVPVARGSSAAETWHVTRRLDLHGAAFDYPALTGFLRELSAQPELGEARLVESSAPEGAGPEIDFSMTAVTVPGGGKR